METWKLYRRRAYFTGSEWLSSRLSPAKPKSDDDIEMGMRENGLLIRERRPGKKTPGIRTRINWDAYMKLFAAGTGDSLFEDISSYLLQTPAGLSFSELKPFLQTTGRQALVQSITLRLMGSPEYKLC